MYSVHLTCYTVVSWPQNVMQMPLMMDTNISYILGLQVDTGKLLPEVQHTHSVRQDIT